jgi:hypothetical protein
MKESRQLDTALQQRQSSFGCSRVHFRESAGKSYGGLSEREIPGPIPNPEVKPLSADGTATEGLWESRTSPDILSRRPPRSRGGLLAFHAVFAVVCGARWGRRPGRIVPALRRRGALGGAGAFRWASRRASLSRAGTSRPGRLVSTSRPPHEARRPLSTAAVRGLRSCPRRGGAWGAEVMCDDSTADRGL